MNIVGFNFTKVAAERKRAVVGTININNNIKIKEIGEAKIGIGGSDRKALKVSFTFSSEYTEDMATLQLEGDLLLLLEKKKADDMLKGWKDGRKIPDEVAQKLMTHILDRCNIQALLLSKDLNLPSPVPLPKVNVGQQGKEATAPAKKAAKKK